MSLTCPRVGPARPEAFINSVRRTSRSVCGLSVTFSTWFRFAAMISYDDLLDPAGIRHCFQGRAFRDNPSASPRPQSARETRPWRSCLLIVLRRESAQSGPPAPSADNRAVGHVSRPFLGKVPQQFLWSTPVGGEFRVAPRGHGLEIIPAFSHPRNSHARNRSVENAARFEPRTLLVRQFGAKVALISSIQACCDFQWQQVRVRK